MQAIFIAIVILLSANLAVSAGSTNEQFDSSLKDDDSMTSPEFLTEQRALSYDTNSTSLTT